MSLTTEQNKLFEENKGLAYATVHRRFSNPTFHSTHGLEKDDLFHYALIGLYSACRDFDPSKGSKFSGYAINRIVWSINDESRRDSLNNIDDYTFDLLDKTSVDKELYEGFTLLDSLEGRETGFSEFESNYSIERLDREVSKGLSKMVQLRIKGYTYQEIGDSMSITHQAVRQRLLKYKNEIMQCLTA